MPSKTAAPASYTDNQLNVKVVTSLEELSHVFAVRAICFAEDQSLPVDLTYDGNDFQATHVLMRCDDEPIGSIRIRWFHDFAQFDRTGVRPSYRHGRALHRMAHFAFDHVARKGFTRIVTHTSKTYARLWQRMYGFKIIDSRPTFRFGEYTGEHFELEREVQPSESVINRDTRPEVIHRIEGYWDEPTRFEGPK